MNSITLVGENKDEHNVIGFISGRVCVVSILPAVNISQDHYRLENYSAGTVPE